MKAQSGDWLVVHSHSDGGRLRKAAIIGTRADGEPPFSVRWIDDDSESVIFPGPDAEVITAAAQEELDRAQATRISDMQSAIGGQHTS